MLRITLPDGIGAAGGSRWLAALYLTLLIGPAVPLPAPKAVIDALDSVEVTINSTGTQRLQLSFTLSNRSPLQTVSCSRRPAGAELRVVIMVTVNGIPQVLMDGVMRHTRCSRRRAAATRRSPSPARI